ncbi:hypothetical protein LBYS11_12335 [Lysinibacillus sp. YS11]|nr:hypothetical protein LBYS11_12335 [Lysinibacillus sp. YS11]
MKLDIQRIERENERLRAENLFLKKLEEKSKGGVVKPNTSTATLFSDSRITSRGRTFDSFTM